MVSMLECHESALLVISSLPFLQLSDCNERMLCHEEQPCLMSRRLSSWFPTRHARITALPQKLRVSFQNSGS